VVGDGLAEGVGMGPMHTARALERAEALLAETEKSGATVTRLGTLRDEAKAKTGHFMAPMIATNVAEDSRLMREVRDKRGYAYSTYSYFSPMTHAGPFVLGLQTKIEQTDDALKVARDTLRQFIAEGPSEAELKQARDNLTGGFPLRIDSNKKILDYQSMIGFYRLPLDYLDTWIARVEAVDVAAVKRAFAARIDPDRMVTIVVGAGSGSAQP
jgi:predicted Zn-dependent peptidase